MEVDPLGSTIPQRYVWAAELLDVQPDDHILEVGCGYGHSIPLISEKLTSGHLTSIDRSAKMADEAVRANHSHIAAGKVEVVHIDLLNFKPSGQIFDKIFLFNLNVFWMDPVNELDAIRLLLSPNGKLVVFHQPPPGHELGEFVDTITQNLTKNRFEPTDTIINEGLDVRSICIKARVISLQ